MISYVMAAQDRFDCYLKQIPGFVFCHLCIAATKGTIANSLEPDQMAP